MGERLFPIGDKDLKSCPFCGAVPMGIEFSPEVGRKSYVIRCRLCHASSDLSRTPQIAIALWELRHQTGQQQPNGQNPESAPEKP